MPKRRSRYVGSLRLIHWLMAVLVLLAYVLIEQRGWFPRGSGGRRMMMQGHFWVGLSILALVFWRIAARMRSGVPAITPPLPAWQAMGSKLLHVALYTFFIVMPVLGLAAAWSDGKPVFVPFTDMALPALLPEDHATAEWLEDLHESIGEAFYWVIGLHIAATLWHHWVRRDDTLLRML